MFNNMLMGAAGESTKATSFPVDNSAVFNDGDSQYLNKTFGSPSSASQFGYSFWVKLAAGYDDKYIISADGSGNNDNLYFDGGKITIQEGGTTRLQTNAVLRDQHAWYNVVVAYDLGNGTNDLKLRLYLNGTEITSFATNTRSSLSSTSSRLNANGISHDIAANVNNGVSSHVNPFDGYLAEFVFLDGTVITPSDVGETDSNGVWRPIDVSGLTFGNNGFYLPFTNSVGLGQDYSGVTTANVVQKNTYNAGSEINEGDTAANPITAMKFVPIASGTVSKIELNASSRGFSGVTVRLETDGGSGTAPSGTLVTNGEVTGITSSGSGLKTATFSTPPTVVAGTTYWIGLRGDTGTWGWQHDVSGVGPALGLYQGSTQGYYSGRGVGHYVYMTGNHWTPGNSPTQSTDTCTNNHITWTKLKPTTVTTSQGNTYVDTGGTTRNISGSIGLTTGKWYWEIKVTSNVAGFGAGLAKESASTSSSPFSANMYAIAASDGTFYNEGSGGTSGTGLSTNDIMGLAYDADAGKIWIAKNNTWMNSGDPAGGSGEMSSSIPTTEAMFPITGTANVTMTAEAEFGATTFTYTPPTGFNAINTTNLFAASAPAIEDGSAYMQSSLWSGNSSSQTVSQSGNSTFTSDWVWIKDRNFGNGGNVFDSVRGSSKGLATFDDGTEDTNSDGVTFGAGTIAFTGAGNTGDINTSGRTYVGWQWLAGNGTVSNSDGSLSSTVSANQTAGFSIVSYTGNGGDGGAQTVGHGLSGKTPKMILIKNRSATNNWVVYHFNVGLNAITLNTNAARITTGASVYWNDTHPTSSVFTVNTNAGVNGSGNNMIAYCFADVPGYSKFGAYIGNASSDGPFVELGFRPAFVMIKAITQAESWWIGDDLRDGYNQGNRPMLTADQAAAEDNGWSGNAPYDALSNGFKIRRTGGAFNTSGGVGYLYMAFAVHPFAGTTPGTAR